MRHKKIKFETHFFILSICRLQIKNSGRFDRNSMTGEFQNFKSNLQLTQIKATIGTKILLIDQSIKKSNLRLKKKKI
jgi:hypothetical protein